MICNALLLGDRNKHVVVLPRNSVTKSLCTGGDTLDRKNRKIFLPAGDRARGPRSEHSILEVVYIGILREHFASAMQDFCGAIWFCNVETATSNSTENVLKTIHSEARWVPGSVWGPLPTAATGTTQQADDTSSLADQLAAMSLRRPPRHPPPAYMCHLCFKKGHYIGDCPQTPLLLSSLYQPLDLPHSEKGIGRSPPRWPSAYWRPPNAFESIIEFRFPHAVFLHQTSDFLIA
ncbi:jg3692 [Pararge aegeria aegeria]|uniref:Jg3692 protein n=1 Tax=Pararge aegeria aegeria TaxID=348720 RepID=A0A8S4S1Y5_9NEOP|nr:jg3692 [Pararge aegeria aegeria]